MTIVSLATYLKMYRKRTGFTHEEVAFLIGAQGGSSVSRHESGDRLPTLKTAIVYEAIFGTAIGELYAGVFADATEMLRERARGLRVSLETQPQSAARDRKIAALEKIIGADEEMSAA